LNQAAILAALDLWTISGLPGHPDASGRPPFAHCLDQSAGGRLTNGLIVIGESYGHKYSPDGSEQELCALIHVQTALELVPGLRPSQRTYKPCMHFLSKNLHS
jgi:hypothetical protein